MNERIKEYLDYIIGYTHWILFVLWATITSPYNSYIIKKRKERERTIPVTPEMMDKKISDLKKFYKD
jgi:hypothetical protein